MMCIHYVNGPNRKLIGLEQRYCLFVWAVIHEPNKHRLDNNLSRYGKSINDVLCCQNTMSVLARSINALKPEFDWMLLMEVQL